MFKGFESVLSLGPVKILLDGSLGGKTAFLKEPYIGERDYRGILIHKPDELYELMKAAHTRNLPAACHAIGNGAIELFSDTVEKLQIEYPNESIRHRVIHCQITDMQILERIAGLNVCVDIEPSFVPTDYSIVSQRVGEDKAKTMLGLGIHVGSGSDAPVEKIDPFLGLHAAVTRTDLNGRPEGGWNPEQRLTIEQVLNIYTMGSAYVCGRENITGSISRGKLADMIIIDRNPLKIDSGEIPYIKVLNTILNGVMQSPGEL